MRLDIVMSSKGHNFRNSHLKTSMVPSSDAQAMELDPWQKTNAFIFQPANRPRRVSLNNSQAYKINTLYDNMVSSVSGLDEANPVL